MNTFIKGLLSCLFISFLLFSCKDDDNDSFEDENTDETTNQLTPGENKAKLEQIAIDFIDQIKASEQKELVQTIESFAELADEYDLKVESNALRSTMTAIRNMGASTNLDALRAYSDPEIYNYADYFGVYTLSNGQWVRTASDSKLEFIFTANGKSNIITISGSNNNSQIEIEDKALITLPKICNASIKAGSTELLNLSASLYVDQNGNNANYNVTMTMNGFAWNIQESLSDALLSYEYSLSKGSKNLIKSTAKVNGSGMVNTALDGDNEALGNAINSGEVNINIMDEINIKGYCNSVNTLVSSIQSLPGHGESEEYNRGLANLVTQYITIEMTYSESSEVIAKIEYQPYYETYPYCYYQDYINWNWVCNDLTYWDIEPIIVFAADNSRYSFEEYFNEDGFSNLIRSIEKLQEDFETIVNN